MTNTTNTENTEDTRNALVTELGKEIFLDFGLVIDSHLEKMRELQHTDSIMFLALMNALVNTVGSLIFRAISTRDAQKQAYEMFVSSLFAYMTLERNTDDVTTH